MEERSEERGIKGERITKKACQEEERCEEEILDSHSTAKRARVSAVFTESQETTIVEFMKDHSKINDKENTRFHDRPRTEVS